MIVVDASVALAGLLRAGVARQALGEEQLHTPHLADVEVANGLRRLAAGGEVPDEDARSALLAWQRLGVTRYPMVALLSRTWELRVNLSAYDATYVALAEALGCTLWTADAKLARAPGSRCPITVVPR